MSGLPAQASVATGARRRAQSSRHYPYKIQHQDKKPQKHAFAPLAQAERAIAGLRPRRPRPLTASTKPRARSAFSRADNRRPARRIWVDTAVFNPLKLKLKSLECNIGRGSATTPLAPDSASFETAGPPGLSRPSNFAVLSNASPAASSSVSHSVR